MSGQVFTLDQGDKETLEATIHLPQTANPGDVLTVQQDRSIAAAPGGGGTGDGGVSFVALLFNEPAGPHADLVATLPIAAGSRVLDVVVLSESAGTWADACTFVMGDTSQPTGYANSDLNSMSIQASGLYDPTLGSGATSIGSTSLAGDYRANAFYSAQVPDTGVGAGVEYPIGGTITATLGGIVTGGGGGAFLVFVMIQAPLFPVEAA